MHKHERVLKERAVRVGKPPRAHRCRWIGRGAFGEGALRFVHVEAEGMDESLEGNHKKWASGMRRVVWACLSGVSERMLRYGRDSKAQITSRL